MYFGPSYSDMNMAIMGITTFYDVITINAAVKKSRFMQNLLGLQHVGTVGCSEVNIVIK